jgi:hypothetical protein
MSRRLTFAALAAALFCGAHAQVIQFESGGLRYQTLSRNGVTIMFAYLPTQLRQYDVLQVAVSNGSGAAFAIRPEDFAFRRPDGTTTAASPARKVVDSLLQTASRNDVIKLVTAYEAGLFGISRFRSTNGYEQRRQAFLAEMGSNKLHAAAAASAIAFVTTKLTPGDSTDGAVFFDTGGKPLGAGKLTVRAAGQAFEFDADPEGNTKTLRRRDSVINPR